MGVAKEMSEIEASIGERKMASEQKKNRKAVRRDRSENYILTSLIAFGITVISVRVFLQLTGFPQIGNSVLHIAHALWGALLLFIAVFLPLALANRWAIQASALLSGVGIGLFIDEVGKFITQTNDYFFPPALPLIYSFFLLVVIIYLLFRRPRQADPRKAMYQVLEGLQDALDSDLDRAEGAQLEAKLAVAKQSDQEEIAALAAAVGNYLDKGRQNLPAAKSGFWRRTARRADAAGRRLGRKTHHRIITLILLTWFLASAAQTAFLTLITIADIDFDSQLIQSELTASELAIYGNSFWMGTLILLNALLAVLVLVATISWLKGSEVRGLKVAILAALFSLVALQPLSFYLNQFTAIVGALLLFIVLLILLAYRRWYIGEEN